MAPNKRKLEEEKQQYYPPLKRQKFQPENEINGAGNNNINDSTSSAHQKGDKRHDFTQGQKRILSIIIQYHGENHKATLDNAVLTLVARLFHFLDEVSPTYIIGKRTVQRWHRQLHDLGKPLKYSGRERTVPSEYVDRMKALVQRKAPYTGDISLIDARKVITKIRDEARHKRNLPPSNTSVSMKTALAVVREYFPKVGSGQITNPSRAEAAHCVRNNVSLAIKVIHTIHPFGKDVEPHVLPQLCWAMDPVILILEDKTINKQKKTYCEGNIRRW